MKGAFFFFPIAFNFLMNEKKINDEMRQKMKRPHVQLKYFPLQRLIFKYLSLNSVTQTSLITPQCEIYTLEYVVIRKFT